MPNHFNTTQQQELLSEEMHDFISNKPHWIVRRGNTIFILLLIGLISMAWTIENPDIKTAPLRIVAVDAPKLRVAKTEGKLEKLLVANDEQVHAGQALAFLQSTGDHQQVLQLYQWITNIEPQVMQGNLDILLQKPLPAYGMLGEAQPAYQDFENAFKETQQLLRNGFYQQKKQALLRDIGFIQDMQKTARQQKELLDKDLVLQQEEYDAKESLAKEKVIAPLEFNQDKSKLLSKQQSIEQFNTQLINNNMAAHNKEKEILELQKQMIDQQQKFYTALFNLKSRLQEWMTQYIVTANISGKINYVGFLQENQYVQTNQELFYIIPVSNKFYGELKTSQAGIGKIKQGQKVIIRVNSFPSAEFGYLDGVISYIPSLVKSDSSVLIKVDFTNGLKTNYGRELLFKTNMNATAEVITDNRRLPERFMGQLRDIMRR
jgi:multidrug resistance efflux pump